MVVVSVVLVVVVSWCCGMVTISRWVGSKVREYVVFESPVRSSLLVPSTLDCNCNWSFQIKKPQRTGPNCERLVFCGLLWLQDQF